MLIIEDIIEKLPEMDYMDNDILLKDDAIEKLLNEEFGILKFIIKVTII